MRVEESRISKAAINPYRGSEIPRWRELGLDPDRIYRLFRDPRELEKGAHTFDGKPLLIRHVPTTAEIPARDYWVGTLGITSFESPYLVTRPLTVLTQEAIDAIESNEQSELSAAYRYDAEMSPGSWGGESYDGRMVNIRGNHVAIVPEGRAGHDVHVADEMPEDFRMTQRATALAVLLKPHLKSDADLNALAMALDATGSAVGETEAKSVMTLDAREGEVDEREKAMDESEEEREGEDEAKDASEEESDKDKRDEEAADRKRARDARRHARDSRKRARDERVRARDSRKRARDERAEDAKRAKDREAEDRRRAGDAAGKNVSQNISTTGGKDAQVDHRDDFDPIKAKDELSRSLKAELSKQFHDAAVAREAVRPIVGVVSLAMDAADDIYAYALKQAGVETKGVHASAYPAMLELAIKAKKASSRPASALAMDSGGAAVDIDELCGLKVA